MNLTTDDPTGGRWLKAWIKGLCDFQPGKSITAASIRMIHPGLTPVGGDGLLSAQAIGTYDAPGESPQSLSVLRVPYDLSGDQFEADEHAALLGAVLTLLTDRCCQVVPELTVGSADSDQILFLPIAERADSQLYAPMIPWEQSDRLLRDFLLGIATLEDEKADAICAAAHMHYCASLLVTRDLTAAYALVVGGLEALAQQFGQPPTEWEEWDQAASWDNFFSISGLTDVQAQATRDRLIRDKKMRLADTFATYVSTRLPGGFWREEVPPYDWTADSASGTWIEGSWGDPKPRGSKFDGDRDELKRDLKAAYQVRSQFVHAGKKNVTIFGDMFENHGLGSSKRPSLAQLRACLRRLILVEIQDNRSPTDATLDVVIKL